MFNKQEMYEAMECRSYYRLIDKYWIIKYFGVSTKTAERRIAELNLVHRDQNSINLICDYINGLDSNTIANKYQCSATNANVIISKFKLLQQNTESLDLLINANRLQNEAYLNKSATLFNLSRFKYIKDEESAYWLGYISADGCVYKNELVLSSIDLDIINKFNTFMQRTQTFVTTEAKISTFKGKDYSCKEFYTARIHNAILINNLKDWEIKPNKSINNTFPKNISDNLLKHYIRGYFDGNGSFYKCLSYSTKLDKTHTKYGFSIEGTETFILDLQQILAQKFNKTYSTQRRHDTETCCLSLRGNGYKSVREFLDWIYVNANVYMDRKYNKYLQLM